MDKRALRQRPLAYFPTVRGLIEVTTVSLWTSMDAVKAFAGEDPEQAKFYPGDEELLAEKDSHADHYEVVSSDLDPNIDAQRPDL